MTAQNALDCLQELLNHLWNSSDRFTDGDIQDLIQALEEFAIPCLKNSIEAEKIADRFIETGLPGPILTQADLAYILGIKELDNVIEHKDLSI